MKEYIKPIVEVVDFQSKDAIMNGLNERGVSVVEFDDPKFEDWG